MSGSQSETMHQPPKRMGWRVLGSARMCTFAHLCTATHADAHQCPLMHTEWHSEVDINAHWCTFVHVGVQGCTKDHSPVLFTQSSKSTMWVTTKHQNQHIGTLTKNASIMISHVFFCWKNVKFQCSPGKHCCFSVGFDIFAFFTFWQFVFWKQIFLNCLLLLCENVLKNSLICHSFMSSTLWT